jgi:hypothetical protein
MHVGTMTCNDFTPTAFVCSMMTWGGIWHYLKLDMGREIATGWVARIWEEDESRLSSA